MPSLFAGPPKAPKPPMLQQPQRDTALDAQLLAMKRRQLGQAGVLSKNSAPANVLTHTVTGG